MNKNKLLKLDNMDTWAYKKPGRELSCKEINWIKKYCIKTNPCKPVVFPDCINECLFSNHPCNCTKEMINVHNDEEIYKYEMITRQSLTFMNKVCFQNSMKNITKEIGEYFLPFVWITISPKKFEKKIDNLRISILLDKTLRRFFYECFKKCDDVKWVIEFGENGNHAHTHILCRPIEEQQKSFVKNFSRDFTTLWKKWGDYKWIYKNILDNKKYAFKCSTLRRPEFIDDKLKYMKNETKDAIHDNPFDEELFSKLKIKKYENC